MCGIAGAVGKEALARTILMRDALVHRGPDDEGIWHDGDVALGHTRLAIKDLDRRAACPYISASGQTVLVYNGEVWNHHDLRVDMLVGKMFKPIRWRTTGDTEVVAEWMDSGLPLSALEGMFAFAWWDGLDMRIARDRFGEIPAHVAPIGRVDRTEDGDFADGWLFASEIKAMQAAGVKAADVRWIDPGTSLSIRRMATGRWRLTTERWYDAPTAPWSGDGLDAASQRTVAAMKLRARIEQGVCERGVHADVPVCTLLSGGIDSSAVAYHLREVVPNLVAFTAVQDPKGADLKQARFVAEALEIQLVEVPIPVPTKADLAQVVRAIEMPFKAQVEIAWSCLHLAREIRDAGFKVAFSGEGADELWASYGFTYYAQRRQDFDWHEYRKDLFVGQHSKNFARCNKVFMAHGVECRLPFLHTPLVEFGLSLPAHVVADGPYGSTTDTNVPGRPRAVPKAIMRDAYDGLLPPTVISRHKLAFQDGNGSKKVIQSVLANEGLEAKSFYRSVYRELYA